MTQLCRQWITRGEAATEISVFINTEKIYPWTQARKQHCAITVQEMPALVKFNKKDEY